MSTCYSAYLGKKTKEGIYEVIGSYVYDKKDHLKINSIWWRSQSFIRWNDWEAMPIPVDKFGARAEKLCVEDFGGTDRKYSIGYWISEREIYARGSCEPIRGFLPIEEARSLIASGYDQEYISWGLSDLPLSAEFVAGLSDSERSKYSFVSYIDRESVEYHMWELGCILRGYEDYNLVNEDEGEEFGVIIQVG